MPYDMLRVYVHIDEFIGLLIWLLLAWLRFLSGSSSWLLASLLQGGVKLATCFLPGLTVCSALLFIVQLSLLCYSSFVQLIVLPIYIFL